MVLIADRPGDRCWGKLYEFAEDQAEETDRELLKALVESNVYLDANYVNEALDVGDDFGI